MDTLALFNLLQFIGGIILSIGYIPQIIKIVKLNQCVTSHESMQAVSLLGLSSWKLIFAYMYFVLGTAGAFMLTNTIALTLSGIEFFLINLYWNRNK